MNIDTLIERAWRDAVDEVRGERAVAQAVQASNISGPLRVAAVGKAAPSMLLGLLRAGVEVEQAIVVSKDGHSLEALQAFDQVRQLESAHPVPDQRSLQAGAELQAFVDSCTAEHHLLLLVSGGASSLAEHLQVGETLESLREKTQALLSAGADIAEINSVRRQLSLVKGGGLCARCPAQLDSWLLSDVEGDSADVIGSGIGAIAEPSRQRIVASNAIARAAAVTCLGDAGLQVLCDEESLYGDVFDLADQLSNRLIDAAPGAYVIGGEPTVVLPEHPGEGGRNQALALALSTRLAGRGVVGLVAGTDGTDGPTLAAGGWFGRMRPDSTVATTALEAANAGPYLREIGQDFITGPTGTNVMDLLIAIKS